MKRLFLFLFTISSFVPITRISAMERTFAQKTKDLETGTPQFTNPATEFKENTLCYQCLSCASDNVCRSCCYCIDRCACPCGKCVLRNPKIIGGIAGIIALIIIVGIPTFIISYTI